MSENPILPWIAVNELMEDTYRKIVVQIALSHLPHASKDLQTFARTQFNKYINIPGFRSFDRANPAVAIPYVISAMQRIPPITEIVICLWGEAMSDLISTFRTHAESKGLRFRASWDWHQVQSGYYPFGKVSALDTVCDEYVAGKAKPEADHVKLAVLWLSRALIPESDATNVYAETTMVTQPQEFLQDVPMLGSSDIAANESPATLLGKLQSAWEETQQAQKDAVSEGRQMLAALEESSGIQARDHLQDFLNKLERWETCYTQLCTLLKQITVPLQHALSERPDLETDRDDKFTRYDANESPHWTTQRIIRTLEQILDYDRQRQDILAEWTMAYAQMTELRDRLIEWNKDPSRPLSFESALPHSSSSLTSLRLVLDQTKAEVDRLKHEITGYRSTCIEHIRTALQELVGLGISINTIVIDDLTRTTLVDQDWSNLDDSSLRMLEKIISERVETEQRQAQARQIPVIVNALRAQWDDQRLATLLEQLALKHQDVEAVLVLLASNEAQPRITPLTLSRNIVTNLLSGIRKLADPEHPYELLNQIATHFLSGWNTVDHLAQLELCYSLIGAQFTCGQWLPTALLWNLIPEWPIRGMSAWEKIWQETLCESPLPFLYSRSTEQANQLRRLRIQAEQALERHSGRFVRLNALRHNRHIALLNSEFLPPLAAYLSKLTEIHDSLDSTSSTNLNLYLRNLETLSVSQKETVLNEEDLDERYEAQMAAEQIYDRDTFHLRTALGVLRDCINDVRKYQDALFLYAKNKVSQAEGVCIEDLQAEANKFPDLIPTSQAVLEKLGHPSNIQPRNEDTAWAQGLRQITYRLLSDTDLIRRMPRCVAHLISASLVFTDMLEIILEDLATPMDTEATAQWLLDQQTSHQVVLLTPHISLGLQKKAQLTKAEQERRIAELQTELLKIGGNVDDLIEDRTLGRWGIIQQELEKRLAECQDCYNAAVQQKREYAHRLRREINDLDENLFKDRNLIPADSYQLVQQGFVLARTITDTLDNLDSVAGYLKEVRYRLDHHSWSLNELQDALEHLQRSTRRESIPLTTDFDVSQILSLLERDERAQLGLGSEVSTSETTTRAELLRNWLRLGEMPSILIQELSLGDRNTIRNLFRRFAQMVKMKHASAPGGKPLDFDEPTIFSHWELQYPKTDVLRSNCILLTLPGRPPRPDQIKLIEDLIDEKEWLDDSFVLLFSPGCTEKMRHRIQSHFANRRLVIIDDQTMMAMVLAEAKDRTPLGRLRSIMLNACGAESVEVFRVNQLVNSRTAIFVGRDAIVDQIVNSDGSFALYGGRRIGKSSVLMAVGDRLEQLGVHVVLHSFDGEPDCSDDASARKLAQRMRLTSSVYGIDDFKSAMQNYLDANPKTNVVLLLDEIDRYIEQNSRRHVLIEALRSLGDEYAGRFRVVIAGFMKLYNCVKGRGPYTPTSDPWRRMLNDIGPLPNIRASSAERIVREGFIEILGWELENRGIPQLIVERTGAHPAFVQQFCSNVQQLVAKRGDRIVKIEDIESVFADSNPERSFMAYVWKTLEMNLDPISRYLIIWLASDPKKTNSFTLDQAREIASTSDTEIPEKHLLKSLEQLRVNSVVEERSTGVYEFSVPDYPLILERLGRTRNLDYLESEIQEYLARNADTY